ncbi:DUF58 domain-containing protein [Bifidobacterium sp. SO1]|uniref:DUF58 domain-containing protein n=1 Tax=Bifidobacterium sp. SO1 TaxID=2809029 RepID=UPI001BDD5A8F|nr:DUF58 domain-containing protein [Bifidobacterium sp. SO1]MBT1161067.1 DUF58 domain-containing protein [Bifidobacterium sp. SO1]
MIGRTPNEDPIRRKIESLGTSLSLPTVRKALGVLEGEHASGRRGGNDDVMDIHVYGPGDEARAIDWKASARLGRPMAAQRERRATSRVWLLLDVGREMTGACEGGEQAWQIAANALRMFAALSLRRSDDISLVFGDAASITRVPFHGGFSQFERTLDQALEREWAHERNIDALLEYARRIRDRDALIVLATDEHALGQRHVALIGRIARTHPVVLIDVATINPFVGHAGMTVVDGVRRRRVPSFLRDAASAEQVNVHRGFVAASLQRELARCGSRMIRGASSEAMFDEFVQLVSLATVSPAFNEIRSGGVR